MKKVAFITLGCKVNQYESNAMAEQFIKLMQKRHPELMTEKYGIGQESGFAEALEIIAKQRNALKSGGVADTDKAVKFLIDDFRSGKIGHISLEEP